jgi:branched-chain amino acid transport system substrate-binding protein
VATIPVSPNAANPAGDGKATCSGVTLAYGGAETGPNAQLGINIVNGVQLAINQHNAANPGCQVQFKKFDTGQGARCRHAAGERGRHPRRRRPAVLG